MYEINFQHEVK